MGVLLLSTQNVFDMFLFTSKVKVKQSHYRPGQALSVPRGVPRFQDNRHMKVVSLSALRTGRLYPPGNIPGNSFLLEAESPPGP